MSENDGLIKDSAMSSLRRVISTAEGRSAITGEALSLSILPSQVAIRSVFLAKSTSNSETSALRAFLYGFIHGTEDPNREIILAEFSWLEKARVNMLSEAMREAAEPPSTYTETARRYAHAFRQGVRGRSLDGLSEEELLRQVSGVRRENPDKVVNKNNTSLFWKDYMTIMMELSEYDPKEAMTRFVETGEFSPGVARVAIAALYLTGCRPIELFGINLYVPRIDMRYTTQQRDLTRQSPILSLHERLLRPVEQENHDTGISRGLTVMRAAKMTGAAPVLSILSAKQKNANKDLRFPVRFLVLDDISMTNANLLSWAAEFRKADKSDAARRRMTTQTLAILKTICATDPSMRQDITLYTFRHSFSSRARVSMEEHECSALTGHTAVRTFRGYGERSPKRTGGGWMPKPDPERADMIKSIWEGLVIDKNAIEAALETQAQKAVAQIEDAPKAIPTEAEAPTPPKADEGTRPLGGVRLIDPETRAPPELG